MFALKARRAPSSPLWLGWLGEEAVALLVAVAESSKSSFEKGKCSFEKEKLRDGLSVPIGT